MVVASSNVLPTTTARTRSSSMSQRNRPEQKALRRDERDDHAAAAAEIHKASQHISMPWVNAMALRNLKRRRIVAEAQARLDALKAKLHLPSGPVESSTSPLTSPLDLSTSTTQETPWKLAVQRPTSHPKPRTHEG